MYDRVWGTGDIVEELAAMGFATVTPEGYYYATEVLKNQVIPREDKYLQRQKATC